jgi:hypothetical protein
MDKSEAQIVCEHLNVLMHRGKVLDRREMKRFESLLDRIRLDQNASPEIRDRASQLQLRLIAWLSACRVDQKARGQVRTHLQADLVRLEHAIASFWPAAS